MQSLESVEWVGQGYFIFGPAVTMCHIRFKVWRNDTSIVVNSIVYIDTVQCNVDSDRSMQQVCLITCFVEARKTVDFILSGYGLKLQE